MNKTNPLWILIGLSVVAIAVALGLTRERWLAAPPQTVASLPAATAESTPTEQPAAGGGQSTASETPTAGASKIPETVQAEPEKAADTGQPATAAGNAKTTEAAQPAVVADAPKTAEAVKTEVPVKTAEVAKTAEAAKTTEVAKTAETVAPAAAAVKPTDAPKTAQALATVTATAAQDNSAALPSFDTVRVEKTGEAVIAGRAPAGSDVAVKLDGKIIGTAIASNDGTFVVIPDAPLPAGSGALTIESTAKNETIAMKSEQTVAVMVAEKAKQIPLVAVVSANRPTKVLQKPEAAAAEPAQQQASAAATTTSTAADATAKPAKAPAAMAVSLDAVDYDDAGNIVFSGRGKPGSMVRLYVDNTAVGDATAGGDSRWSFAGTAPIAAGVHALRVDGIDAKGAVASRLEVPFFREETKKVANAAVSDSGAAAQPTQDGTQQANAAAGTAKPKEGRVVIQPGNSLWRISTVIYGAGTKYTVLYEANKGQIRNPDLIYPGQVFKTPDVVPPEQIDPKRSEPLKPEEGGTSAQ